MHGKAGAQPLVSCGRRHVGAGLGRGSRQKTRSRLKMVLGGSLVGERHLVSERLKLSLGALAGPRSPGLAT